MTRKLEYVKLCLGINIYLTLNHGRVVEMLAKIDA